MAGQSVYDVTGKQLTCTPLSEDPSGRAAGAGGFVRLETAPCKE